VVSQPLSGSESQSAYPEVHAPITQAPPVHAADALAKLHALSHVPQAEVVVSGVSQPLASLESQSP
jgi:hypothetical protein